MPLKAIDTIKNTITRKNDFGRNQIKMYNKIVINMYFVIFFKSWLQRSKHPKQSSIYHLSVYSNHIHILGLNRENTILLCLEIPCQMPIHQIKKIFLFSFSAPEHRSINALSRTWIQADWELHVTKNKFLIHKLQHVSIFSTNLKNNSTDKTYSIHHLEGLNRENKLLLSDYLNGNKSVFLAKWSICPSS